MGSSWTCRGASQELSKNSLSDEDKFWKSNGEVNITGLREVVPNVTRKEVDEAFPGLNRTT
jgi:hypothetical protein